MLDFNNVAKNLNHVIVDKSARMSRKFEENVYFFNHD